MSTEIVRTQGSTLEGKMAYAQALATSSLLPKHYQRQPANLLFALEYADALGVTPIHAITSIYVVDGKPTASADLIAAMVRKAGHKLRISGDDSRAVAELIRADDPDHTFRVEWTMDRARTAGLTGKGVWKNYPAAMLRSRAITEVARAGASDALFGVIYTPEELGATVDAEGAPLDLGEQAAPAPAEPQRTVTRQRKRPEPQPEPQPEASAEVDWIAELDQTGGDVDLIRGLWKRASDNNAEAWVLDAIKQAGIDAAAKTTVETVLGTDALTGELVEDEPAGATA